MSGHSLVLADEPVNVRDSWDQLDTPRTSESELDNLTTTQPIVHIRHSKEDKPKHNHDQKVIRKDSRGRNVQLKVSYENGDACHRKAVSNRHANRTLHYADLLSKESSPMSRPVSANSFSNASRVVPKRYRKMKLRSNDDILQEEIRQLRLLLDDSKNMSREELGQQHVEQTASMIAVDWRGRPLHKYDADYKTLNGGRSSRRIIISQSLPESLRPKSPLSTSTSSFTSSKGSYRERSKSTSHSRSPEVPRSKRVSFKHEPTSPKISNHLSQPIRSKSNFKKPSNSKQSWHQECYSSSSYSQSESQSDSEDERQNSAQHFGNDWSNVMPNHTGNRQTSHNYISKEAYPKTTRKQQQRVNDQVDDSEQWPSLKASGNQTKHGVYRDLNGHKHSDNNLRRTTNPDIKQWLKEKEKAIRSMKKNLKQMEERKKSAAEQEEQKKKERQEESAKQLREWEASKSKKDRLLRRQNLAKRKLEKQKFGSANELSCGKDIKTESTGVKESVTMKPSPPSKPRPMSAPSRRSKSLKPQVPIAEVIKNNPDLQERLKLLEREKRLKHRQSYDEWLKVKEREKRDVMKAMREQRKKVEKEISEETAKLISEAAKRRSENIRYKGSAATQAEKKPNEAEEAPKAEPKSAPYRWKKPAESSQGTPRYARDGKHTPLGSTKVFAQRKLKSTMHAAGRQNVEEKIPDTQANPFSDPLKSKKVHRPKSRLKQNGVNGPEFSRFIRELVNEQENGTDRPEPQGADAPVKSPEDNEKKATPKPKQATSPAPPTNQEDAADTAVAFGEPVIESGRSIFAMTSIEEIV